MNNNNNKNMYIYGTPPKDLPVLFLYWYLRGFTAILRIPPNNGFLKRGLSGTKPYMYQFLLFSH